MKLVDLMLAVALWGICIPVFARQYINIRRSYDATTLRLEALSDIRETVYLYASCHDKKASYPQIEGYTALDESVQFTWNEKVMTYRFR